jgi:hypothetical protein
MNSEINIEQRTYDLGLDKTVYNESHKVVYLPIHLELELIVLVGCELRKMDGLIRQ